MISVGDLYAVEHSGSSSTPGIVCPGFFFFGNESVEPEQHHLEELVGVEVDGAEPLLVGCVFVDAVAPFLHLHHAVHSGTPHRKNAGDDVEGTEHEAAVDAADDVPHHELGHHFGVEHRGEHGIPCPTGASGEDAALEAQPGDQLVQRLLRRACAIRFARRTARRTRRNWAGPTAAPGTRRQPAPRPGDAGPSISLLNRPPGVRAMRSPESPRIS